MDARAMGLGYWACGLCKLVQQGVPSAVPLCSHCLPAPAQWPCVLGRDGNSLYTVRGSNWVLQTGGASWKQR